MRHAVGKRQTAADRIVRRVFPVDGLTGERLVQFGHRRARIRAGTGCNPLQQLAPALGRERQSVDVALAALQPGRCAG